MIAIDATASIDEQARQIKALLRTMMNGPVSTAMRERGLTYKVNFGVELPRLKTWAEVLPHTHELAQRLWREDIRECRLLAGLLQPIETFDAELAEFWIDSIRFPEEAECTSMHLFSRMSDASIYAFRWIAHPNTTYNQCGYMVLSRLLMQGAQLSARDEDEFLNQVEVALRSTHTPVRLAAHKCLLKYMDQGDSQADKADALLLKLEQATEQGV
ncbi:MAG: DNA alkylation repair protein [Bacteroidales bacterium]|nr:DNA alkylation repair protein [Bacteroidales bacterium]